MAGLWQVGGGRRQNVLPAAEARIALVRCGAAVNRGGTRPAYPSQ
jgi:hypothetical protein